MSLVDIELSCFSGKKEQNLGYATSTHNRIQRGSEYQNSLVFEWSKRGWMSNGLVFECHLKTGQIDTILFSYVIVQNWNGRSST